MTQSSYGTQGQRSISDDIAAHVEEIALRGYTIIPGVIDQRGLTKWREKIDAIYRKQEADFGREALVAIQELDVCRAPLLYDFDFIQLAADPTVLTVVERILGSWFILNLQNAVINRPRLTHHQTAWHRDLPYQNFVISRPIGINALIAIDDFSTESGGTRLLPFSHKDETLPSETYIKNNNVTANAVAGSVVLFDVMLFHCAGLNTSAAVRRAVNHLYTTPIVKQQYDFPRALSHHDELSPSVKRLLGFTSQVPIDDKSWRQERFSRLKADA